MPFDINESLCDKLAREMNHEPKNRFDNGFEQMAKEIPAKDLREAVKWGKAQEKKLAREQKKAKIEYRF